MQTDETTDKETTHGEPWPFRLAGRFPTVVVGIADDEAGEYEEEIYGKIAMRCRRPVEALKDMKEHHQQGGDSSKPVQNHVVGLGVGESVVLDVCRRGHIGRYSMTAHHPPLRTR